MTSSAELRQAFLEFFRARGHEVVSSSPLVPANDATLLFTNAGMVQFKDVFLGHDARAYSRAVSSQRCVRAGGKHNDLENVGYTARHHTFFEMLGNFSFGDYFKREAIHYAWEFLTQTLRLPPDRLWITVYDEDDEAADIWLKEIKADPARFSRIGAADNFWSMGDTGPCGPCSEIFYDHGPHIAGGPPGSPDADGDRYVEIWNLVFMQYNRAADGTLTSLPKPSVDTGMGLERLAAVVQGVHSNYDTDVLRTLVQAAARIAACTDITNSSLCVLADHIRACAFLIVDGVMPSNEGRGYVLRRIIRRAIRHGYQLGISETFFYRLVEPLEDTMGAAYPELAQARTQVERILRLEEERFRETLEQGMKILEQDITQLGSRVIPGETVFRLYDTYGFPADLTADIARERNLELDMDGFERAMTAQRERARAASQFGADYGVTAQISGNTEFTGYERVIGRGRITGLYRAGMAVDQLAGGEEGMVILDRTPFYAESGGQAGDRGVIHSGTAVFEVRDTKKQGGSVHVHVGVVREGVFKVDAEADARVDARARQATALNHTATHLLHAALRNVLGEHVVQKGSLVEPERLRFDFAHFEPMTSAQIQEVERLVNAQIRVNDAVETRISSFDEARAAGAMALFGEKYGDEVRVLRIGEFSQELCGGTHAQRAGDIGLFKILSEAGIAAGVRRIEAVTGEGALLWVEDGDMRLARLAELLKGGRDNVEDKVQQLLERSRKLERELEQIKGKLASAAGDDLLSQAVDMGGFKVLAARIDGMDPKALRDTADQIKNKLGSAAVLLATVTDGKVSLVAGVTADQTSRIKAGELVNAVAQQVGGKGGGRPDMAQAGGTDPAGLDGALRSVPEWVRQRLV